MSPGLHRNPKHQTPVPKRERVQGEQEGEAPPILKWAMWIWANARKRPGWALLAAAAAIVSVGWKPYQEYRASLCTWRVPAKFQIDQVDNFASRSIINLTLKQNGKDLTGGAKAVGGTAGLDEGTVQGTLEQNDFKFDISWNGGPIGVYVGSVDPKSGHLQGNSYDKRTRVNTANWSTTHIFTCK